VSRFLDLLITSAAESSRGMTTGEPHRPVRRTWARVHALAGRIAVDLAGGGLAPGTAVAVLAGEPAMIAPAAQGVWLAGGSVTMLHQPTPRTDLAVWAEDTVRVLDMIDAGLVLLGPPFDPLADVLTQRGIAFRPIGSLGAEVPEGAPLPDVPRGADDGEDDTVLLQLTSGSTAEPKAVRITHRNLYSNLTAMVIASKLNVDRDVMVSWLPLFHDMGMVGFLTVPMTVGLELVTVTPADFLSRPLLWTELISRYGGTVTAAPNFAYAVLGRQLARAEDGSMDLSSMRFALNGAEPIDPDAVASFTAAGARFGLRPECVVAAYGMAETVLGVSFAKADTGLEVDTIDADELEAHHRAVPVDPGHAAVRRFPLLGPPLPGLTARVVDDSGRVLGDREVGAIQLRGEAVTPGYLTVHGPEATQDADGWLDTGDQGYLTDGTVVVCGRLKDVIIMGGRNIYPTDIERAAAEVDGVRAGNTVAVRLDAGSGVGASRRESFVVAVESRRAGDAEAAELIGKEVTSRVVSAVGVRPARVVVLPPGSLPKTPSGKLRRAATKALVENP
jgi:fatty-acyl-CoA synthase